MMVYNAQVKPFLSNLMDKMETYNEFSIVLMIEIYTTLLGFKFNKREILSFGYLLNLLIIMMLSLNFFAILFESVYANKLKIKVYFLKQIVLPEKSQRRLVGRDLSVKRGRRPQRKRPICCTTD